MARSIKEQTGVDLGDAIEQPLAIPEPEPSATEEDNRPEWLDQKFESVEAQAKAYSEAQREMSRAQERQRQSESKIEELAARFDELSSQQQQQPDQNLSNLNLLQQYEQAVENGDYLTQFGILSYVNQQETARQIEELKQTYQPQSTSQDANSQMFAMMAEQQVAAKYGDEWETLKPAVGQLLSEHPHLLPDTEDLTQTVNALSLIADMARAQQGAQAQAQQDAGRHQKLMAQTMSGTTGRPDTQQVIDAGDHLIDLMKRVR